MAVASKSVWPCDKLRIPSINVKPLTSIDLLITKITLKNPVTNIYFLAIDLYNILFGGEGESCLTELQGLTVSDQSEYFLFYLIIENFNTCKCHIMFKLKSHATFFQPFEGLKEVSKCSHLIYFFP